jgi:G3E family GTPase
MRSGLPFLDADADGRRMPTLLLCGFLGSGKTTLVNALLRDPRLAGTAVAVNEFGEMPLDRQLIAHDGEATVTMANGCLCCTLSGDVESAVLRLFSRQASGGLPGFARLIIEPSGLADPAPIAQAILRNPLIARALRLDAIVATADALHIGRQVARHAEAGKQIALAEQLVVTKPDLTDEAGLGEAVAALRALNPLAPIHIARDGDVSADALLPPEFFSRLGGTPKRRSPLWAEAVWGEGAADSRHLARVTAVVLTAEAPLRWQSFDTWLRGIRLGHGERLLRLKGLLDIAGATGPVLVQGVHHVLHAPVGLDSWDGAPHRSRLLLVVEDGADAIRASWAAALADLQVRPAAPAEG